MENAALQNMKTRFCCRKFKSTPVEKEKLEAILDAAKYAASGHNAQGWHFTVVTTEESKAELLAAVCPEPPEFKNLAPKGATWPFPADFFGAPVVIMVSYDPKCPWPDCSAYMAAANMMNAAHALGLSACPLTVYSKDVFATEETAVNKAKFIPQGYQLYLSMVVGYPEVLTIAKSPRRQNVETWL